MFKVGDEILVKAEGYDNRNRLNLSRKAALPKPVKKEDNKKEFKEDSKEEKTEKKSRCSSKKKTEE